MNFKLMSTKLGRIMRVSLFLLFAALTQVYSIHTYSQNKRLSLTETKLSLRQLFKAIEKQSEYLFFFVDADVDGIEVNVNAKDASVNTVLNQALHKTGLVYEINNRNITIYPGVTRESHKQILQNITISGKVTDQGDAIPGVNVMVKGTVTGVVTDMNGKYTIQVPGKDAVLVFSFIGYVTEEYTVGDRQTIDVTLREDTQEIEEVVVIGYGTMRKSDLTGTVVRADINAFAESSNTNIMQSLQGSVAGLNVGQVKNAGEDPGVSVRGRNTMSGETKPLIVLDGIIFRGNMVDINPHDIQSIDILKDASATAIYGSQASNGVMLITTKGGTEQGKPIISYSGSFSWQYPTTKDIFPSGRQGFLDKIAATYIGESRTGDDLMTPNPAWDPVTHLMDKNTVDGYNNGTETDWWGMLTKNNGFIQDHNIGIRGKSKTTGYYFSVGYTDQQNIVVNDVFKRYSVRINLDNKVTNWLNIGIQSFLTVSNKPGNIPSVNNLRSLPPLVAVRDAQGQPVIYPYKSSLNPLLEQEIDKKDNRMNLFSNFYADVTIPFIEGLSYRLNFGQNLRNTREYVFNPWGSNLDGSAKKAYGNQYDYTVDNIVTYKRRFGMHNINATFLYGIEERIFDNTTSETEKFVNKALGYNFMQGGQADLQKASSSGWDERSLYSMARLYYSFKNRYMFTGTLRRDGFSGFGANHKTALFPSGALAWVASEESFVKDNLHWLNNLKLRFSYGSSGNRAVSRYQTLSQVKADHGYLYGDGVSPVPAQYVSTLANSDLKWEKTATFNAGIDFSVLGSRLFGSLDLYSGKTNDMLYEIEIPRINGFNKVWTNLGEMTNRGQEIILTGIPVSRGDFQWNITFNFSRNRNKIVTILGRDDDGDGHEDNLTAGGRSGSIFIGKPYGVWYDYNKTGMWQIEDGADIPAGFSYGTYKVEDIDGDGKITADKDRKLIGYKDPSYRFSIQNAFSFKGFEFKFFINAIQGGNNYYMGNSADGMQNPDNVYQYNATVWDWWMPENPGAKYRRLGTYPTVVGESFHPLTSRSFVRLQDVTLSYTFNSKILEKAGLKMLKLYVSGKNLATWTNWDGWDPETGQGFTGADGYPVMKSYSVGLNVEF